MSTRELVIGADVAKEFSEVCILGLDHSVHKRLTVQHDSKESMAYLIQVIKAKEKDFEATATVVLESTGHYHKILERALLEHGIGVVEINPIQSDSIKNLSIRKVKNDRTDAYHLAMLYVFERNSIKTAKPDEASFTTLKMLLRAYYDLQTERTAHFLKLQAYLDQVYLNFDKDCLSLKTAAAQAFLARYPLPENVLQARKNTVENLLKKHSRRGDAWVKDKLVKILAKADTMRQLGSRNSVFAQLIRSEIELYQLLDRQMGELLKNVNSFLLQNAQSNNPKLALQVALLDSIPGIGQLSAMTIVAEAGDITRFKNARALTAFAGLDPSVKESGKFKGKRNRISKRGSRLLRRALNLVASRSVSRTRKDEYVNPYLREFYEQKCQAKPKMVALTAVAHKLIYIIFAVVRNNQPFYWSDPEQHKARLCAA